MREMKRSIAICVATVAVWLSVAPLLGDTEPCTVVPSPPPATLDIRVLQTNPPLLIGAGNDWCSNDITLVTMPVPLKFEVDVSGLDPEGAQEHRIRAGQFFLQYTSESCAGGSSAFDFTAVEAGQPDPPNPNLSPFQEELGWELVLPNIAGGTPGELRYGVGIPLLPTLVPMTACNNALATFTFTATAQGRLIVWFRDPAILPQSLLSDDSGGEIRPPPQGPLVLTQPDPANAVTITVDWTPPTATAPPGATVECVGDIPAAATTYTAFVALGGTASDNCAASADLVITSIDGSLAGSCPSSLTRTYTITDTCGNSVDVNQTINVNDTTPPTAGTPTAATAQCDTALPVAATTHAEFVAIGGSASDNCTADASLTITHVDGTLVGGVCGGTITRTYTITDECNNSASVDQTITVNDTTLPTATAPTAVTVECDTALPTAATTHAEFVAIGGTASDNCTADASLTITHVDGSLVGGVCGGTITRTYTITDACNNAINVDQTITVDDNTPPAITAPSGVTVECPGDEPPAASTVAEFLALLGAVVSDNCTAQANMTITHVSDVSDGQTCPETITRTYRATDECLNTAEATQTIIVQDTTLPTATAPPGAAVECPGDVPVAATTYTEFIALGGTASDNCTSGTLLTVTSSDGTPIGTCPGSITRTYTITDECGNSANVDQVITVNDTTPPTATAPPGTAAQCADSLPAAATTYAEFAALGGSAADNCTATANLAVTSFDGPLVGGPCGGTVTRMYTLTDECLNPVSVGQIITVNDTTPPTGTAPPGASVQCVGDVPAAATTYAGLVALGGTASDNCTLNTNLSITSADGALAGACPSSFTRRYTIADGCGNTVDVDQIITVNDTTLPVVGCGGGITQPADAGGCDAAVSWPAATATDNCDGDLSGSVVYEIDLDNNGSVDATQMTTTFTFPGGTHLVTATATDTCSNTGSCSFTVTITPFNELVVSLELSPTIATGTSPDTLTRCITFELFNCAGGSVAMSQAIDFAVQTGLPTIGTTTLLVPCGAYDCVAIRDELHTLRRTDDDQFGVSPIVGTQYVADFTNRTASSGDDDSLISGNLNDDCWIDVVDFGLLAGVWGTFPSANTGCPITFPPAHADFSGNGQVWTEDFTFILLNMWRFSETNCCNAPPACGGTSGPGGGPIERISVQNLVQIGMMTAAAGDLNEDGWLDVQDIVLWMQGVRPTPRPDPPPPVLQKKWSPRAKEGARVGPQLGGNMEPLPRSSTGEGDENGNGPRTGDSSAWQEGKQRFGNAIRDCENHRRDAGATVLPRADRAPQTWGTAVQPARGGDSVEGTACPDSRP